MRRLDFYHGTFIEVAKPPDIGILAAPRTKLDGYIVISFATTTSLGPVAWPLLAPLIVPLLFMQPPRALGA